MADRRDVPFRTKSMGPSSGQAFRQFGMAGRNKTARYEDVAGELEAMAERFVVAGRIVAEDCLEIMRRNVIKYITPRTGNFHGFSTGRLAATIGRWDPTYIVPSESGADAEQKAIAWADANGVGNYMKDDAEELTIIENGAYSSVKRQRGSSWAVEMGTFTPYAGLVEDGGTMPIASYGNENKTITATWEANHMFKRGMFDSYEEIEGDLVEQTKRVLSE